MEEKNSKPCEKKVCPFLPTLDWEGEMKGYSVFPGIDLIYEEIHSKKHTVRKETSERVFEIRHCREGRLEGRAGEALYYIGPGDLCICRPEKGVSTLQYPLSHYHGITVILDVDQAPRCLSCFLEDVNVEPETLLHKFCTGSVPFVARSMPSISHVFEELYTVPDSIRPGYLKVKILELMLFLSSIDLQTDEFSQRRFSRNQTNLAKKVSAYLSAHMEEKITLEQLAEIFHVSGTQIKCAIKGVYGISLSNLIRIQKMQSAAKLLEKSDLTILEIAGLHGYDNPSKFAGAFKAVTGLTPKEYRNAPTELENFLV